MPHGPKHLIALAKELKERLEDHQDGYITEEEFEREVIGLMAAWIELETMPALQSYH